MKALTTQSVSTYLPGKGKRRTVLELLKTLSLAQIDHMVRIGALRWEGKFLVTTY